MINITLEPEEVDSLKIALDALRAERHLVERIGGSVPVRHTLAQGDLELIIDRVRSTPKRSRWLPPRPAETLGGRPW